MAMEAMDNEEIVASPIHRSDDFLVYQRVMFAIPVLLFISCVGFCLMNMFFCSMGKCGVKIHVFAAKFHVLCASFG